MDTITIPDIPTRKIMLDSIILEPSLQPRLALDTKTITEYAEIYTDHGPAAMDPIRVFAEDEGHVLTRGFTRCAAAQQAGLNYLFAEVYPSASGKVMLIDSLSGNRHGQRLNSADKRRAVQLYHEQVPVGDWMPTRSVGKMIGCSHELVAAFRRTPSEIDSNTKRTAVSIIIDEISNLVAGNNPLPAHEIIKALTDLVPAEIMDNINEYLQEIDEQSDAEIIRVNFKWVYRPDHKDNVKELIYDEISHMNTNSEPIPITELADNCNTDTATVLQIASCDSRMMVTETEADSDADECDGNPPLVPAIRLFDEGIEKNTTTRDKIKEQLEHDHAANWQSSREDLIRDLINEHIETTHNITLTWEQLATITLAIGMSADEDDTGTPASILEIFTAAVLNELQGHLTHSWNSIDMLPPLEELCHWLGADYASYKIHAENKYPEITGATA